MSIPVRLDAAGDDADNASVPAKLELFRTEAQARGRHPGETIVWINLDTAAVHRRGSRWYGKTRHGGYTSARAADF